MKITCGSSRFFCKKKKAGLRVIPEDLLFTSMMSVIVYCGIRWH